jgi:hypothetical protein
MNWLSDDFRKIRQAFWGKERTWSVNYEHRVRELGLFEDRNDLKVPVRERSSATTIAPTISSSSWSGRLVPKAEILWGH